MTKQNFSKQSELKYPSHSKEILRLNKILGQVKGVKKMIEEDRYCMDVVTQCRAIASAIKAVERAILQRHLNACVFKTFNSVEEKQEKIQELLNFFKKK